MSDSRLEAKWNEFIDGRYQEMRANLLGKPHIKLPES
jgi:hypothetical protein